MSDLHRDAGSSKKEDVVGQILMKPRPKNISVKGNSSASSFSALAAVEAEGQMSGGSCGKGSSTNGLHSPRVNNGSPSSLSSSLGGSSSSISVGGRNVNGHTRHFFAARLLRTNGDEHSRHLKLREEELRLKQTQLEMLSSAYTVAEVKKDEVKANTMITVSSRKTGSLRVSIRKLTQ